MNKDEAREAARQKALDELHAKQFVKGRDLRFYGAGFDKGFDAGAASVDRRAVVEKAFKRFKWKYASRDKNGHFPSQREAMDAILAEMRGDDE